MKIREGFAQSQCLARALMSAAPLSFKPVANQAFVAHFLYTHFQSFRIRSEIRPHRTEGIYHCIYPPCSIFCRAENGVTLHNAR